jgi:hypothetical protein
MKKIFKLIAIFLLAITIKPAVAQEVEGTPTDTLGSAVNKLQSIIEQMQHFKITGYVQAQAQFADSAGIKSVAGGNFDKLNDKRFGVRRGRLKFEYNSTLASFVTQIDITEKGVATKDIYMVVRDPWTHAMSLTGGVFIRPFGYELNYSSSLRESPEFARYSQALFPSEEDLGFMLTIQPPKTSPWNILKIQGGFFAGNAINPETDKKKDFIGQISINKPLFDEKVKLGFGASYYNGGVPQQTANLYKIDNGVFVKDATSTTVGTFAKREYVGIDGQLTVDNALGLTTIRGEYVTGTQPSGASSANSYAAATPVVEDLYVRKVKGSYIHLIQAIKGTKHSFVLKYDMFDPNTDVSGDQIGVVTTGNKATNAGDLKYTTTGLGWIYAYSAGVRLMCYYDIVKNETSSHLAGYSKDLKDNVFTVRLQYKF